MKTRYNKILIFGVLTVLLGSCSLNYEPISDPTELTEGKQTDTTTAVLANKAAALNQLKVVYEVFRTRQENLHLDMLLIADCHSDNAYVGTTGAEVVPFETNTLDGGNPDLLRDWDRYLEDIAKSNVLINGIEQLKAKGEINDTEYRQLRAQGQIFRGLMMFRMARYWGSFPVITTIGKTITSKNIHEVFPTYFPPRSTVEECYQQIINDLEYAVENAPDFDRTDRTRLTKTVAQAMLAKVYAEKPKQDYSKVVKYAEDVINTSGLELEPEFVTLWGWDDVAKDCVKRNTSEGILEVHWTTGNGNWESWMYGRCLENYDSNFTWAKWVTPSRDILKDFQNENDTIRLNQSVVYYDCKWSNYYPADHYPFMYKLRSGYNNVYVLRLADIILMEAEAQAYLGNLTKSAELVNMVRVRVKLPRLTADKTASKEKMIETVLHERRLELAFEGERWFDLCRNNKVEKVMNTLKTRDSGRLELKRMYNEHSYLLPIPQKAIDLNSNLQQNPGY